MASRLFSKLNLKDQRVISVLGAPSSFEKELQELKGVTVKRSLGVGEVVAFTIAFASTQDEVDSLSRALGTSTGADPVLWIAYPKGSSKRYSCEFNRDTGWAALGALGFEPVRQVSIDDDWTALRFRRVEFVKHLTRAPERALSRKGKARAGSARR